MFCLYNTYWFEENQNFFFLNVSKYNQNRYIFIVSARSQNLKIIIIILIFMHSFYITICLTVLFKIYVHYLIKRIKGCTYHHTGDARIYMGVITRTCLLSCSLDCSSTSFQDVILWIWAEVIVCIVLYMYYDNTIVIVFSLHFFFFTKLLILACQYRDKVVVYKQNYFYHFLKQNFFLHFPRVFIF